MKAWPANIQHALWLAYLLTLNAQVDTGRRQEANTKISLCRSFNLKNPTNQELFC
jgi:hypothetical protein